MAETLRFLNAGTRAMLVELEGLDETLALLDKLLERPLEGVTDIVPAARTVLVEFDPALTSRRILAQLISEIDLSSAASRQGKTFEIPVSYDGEDLEDVARLLECSVEEVIRRHSSAIYTVAFTGFAPGFAYMSSDDACLEVPRRSSPRIKIPAGSVALAGKFSGIYPSDSPGGWQLIGRTPFLMWDLSRERPALLAPGDRVRFVECAMPAGTSTPVSQAPASMKEGLRILRTDRPALFQDLGRKGCTDQGVSCSGAMDRESLRRANRMVGNNDDTGALEIAFGCFELRADRAVTLAVTGANCPLTIRTASGRKINAPHDTAIAIDEGDELALGFPTTGSRSYLAMRGGFAVEPVLGSVATDTLARVGPAPIVAGDVLVPAECHARAVALHTESIKLPNDKDLVVLEVVLGPRDDWFTPEGLGTFLNQEWVVTPESSRVGLRLQGTQAIERKDHAELQSEATARGAVQIPHSGQPVLFAADHPLTGGYPVIAVVTEKHLDLAGQLPIGARIRFQLVSDQDDISGETIQ